MNFMCNLKTKYFFYISLILGMVFGLAIPNSALASFPGAILLYGACNPGADTDTDWMRINPQDGDYRYKQSCKGHDGPAGQITMENFAAKFKFDPSDSFWSLLASGGGHPALLIGALFNGSKEKWLTVGDTTNIYTTTFSLDREGDQACLYARPFSLFNFKIDTKGDDAVKDGAEDNCFYLPPPRQNLRLPKWPGIISPVCGNLCSYIDDDNNPNTPEVKVCASKAASPFMGVIMQCITETYNNIFYVKDDKSGLTMFGVLQERMKDIIRGLLALYVIFIGYQYVMGKQKVARGEFIWMFLRFALVWYFAAGEGMVVLKPALHSVSNGLSMMIINAARGTQGSLQDARKAVVAAQANVDIANEELKNARQNIKIMQEGADSIRSNIEKLQTCIYEINGESTGLPSCNRDIYCIYSIQHNQSSDANKNSTVCPSVVRDAIIGTNGSRQSDNDIKARNIVGDLQNDITNLQISYTKAVEQANNTVFLANIDSKMSTYNDKVHLLKVAIEHEDSFGYNYCDFNGLFYGDTANSDEKTVKLPDGTTRIEDLSYMRIWDTIDCRFAKYLGIGDYEGDKNTPQMIILAISMIFVSALGIPIFILMIACLAFIVTLIMRVASMVLMAFIGLNIFIYIAPITIPSVLFNYTKKTFEAWLKQIIAYVMQPVIIFAILSFTFVIFDKVIYGDNHNFYPMNYGNEASDSGDEKYKISLRNKIIKYMDPTAPGDYSKATCPDPDTFGCIMQDIGNIFGRKSYGKTPDIGLGDDFMFLTIRGVSISESETIFFALLKLFILSFIIYNVLETLEEMTIRLVDAAGGGAKGLSPMSTAGPIAGGKLAANALAKTAGLAAKGAGGISQMKNRDKINTAKEEQKDKEHASHKGKLDEMTGSYDQKRDKKLGKKDK